MPAFDPVRVVNTGIKCETFSVQRFGSGITDLKRRRARLNTTIISRAGISAIVIGRGRLNTSIIRGYRIDTTIIGGSTPSTLLNILFKKIAFVANGCLRYTNWLAVRICCTTLSIKAFRARLTKKEFKLGAHKHSIEVLLHYLKGIGGDTNVSVSAQILFLSHPPELCHGNMVQSLPGPSYSSTESEPFTKLDDIQLPSY